MGIRFSVCGWKLFHLTTAESGGRKRKLEGAPELIRVLPFLPDINNANGHVSTSVCRRPKRASFISTEMVETIYPGLCKCVNALNGLLSFLQAITFLIKNEKSSVSTP